MGKSATTCLRISNEAMKKIVEIQKTRPQDTNNAQTFDHILYVYEEQQFKPVKP